VADGHLIGVLAPQHELQHPVGEVEKTAGTPPSQHVEANPRPDAERQQPVLQGRMGGESLHPNPASLGGLAEPLGGGGGQAIVLHAGNLGTTRPAAVAPLPDADRILTIERGVRRQGTGLPPAELEGCWRLERVWNKGSRAASPAAGLLRALAARLEIRPVSEAESGPGAGLRLANAVNLGPLELRFEGEGELRGRRPLLVFWFDRVAIRLAGRVLLQRRLERPQTKRLPFFALIAREPGEDGWLAARGRSGGLALWRRVGRATDGPPATAVGFRPSPLPGASR